MWYTFTHKFYWHGVLQLDGVDHLLFVDEVSGLADQSH